MWLLFPSSKNDGPRTTPQRAHRRATVGRKNKEGKYEGGCGIECRLYDMRHTFATRFALAGGSLPVLARILGRADLSLLMRYVHPSQADMDRAMEWYSTRQEQGPELEKMLLENADGTNRTERWLGQLPGQLRLQNWPKLAQLSQICEIGKPRDRHS